MTLFGRYFWTSNYVNEQPKKFPTCHVRNISIYAPTRGATPIRDDLRQVQAISIHAPTRGATGISKTTLNDIEFQSTLLQEERPVFWFLKPPIKDFNPRSYKRSDFSDQLKAMDGLEFQSTLLQEERLYCRIYGRKTGDFNPRSYKRSDSKNAQ